MATVFIPTVMRSFSDGRDRITVPGKTLRQVFVALDAVCPGILAQLVQDEDVRPGLAIAIDGDITSQGLVQSVGDDAEIHVLPALGGG